MAVKKKPTTPAPEAGELSLIRKLAAILNETGLTEIELDHKGAKVRVAKMMQAAAVVHAAPAMVHTPAVMMPVTGAAPAAAVAEIAGTPLKSPMVGTAYLLPAPDAAPFVTVGTSVKEGQTVLIIEAMKTMNQIVAPKAGKVVKINVENAQPVEFGEVLMVIE
ncbi:MAG: acetyl-CoA carboxylase biotin carboxyl carrier protein [Pseudomonadota bacterium]|nr:acetyl-CoA carboxylase biotin carboxyl carrier protein [Pseudomonadota bacterium]